MTCDGGGGDLVLLLAGVSGMAGLALLGASWLRGRRKARERPTRRPGVRGRAGEGDPILASRGLDQETPAERRDRE